MTVNEERESKLCRVAPLVLSLMQLSSSAAWVFTETQIAGVPTTQLEVILFTAWIMVSLSPILLLRLIRRICVLIGVMAIPIIEIFCGRIHYTFRFLQSKPPFQTGYCAIWLNNFFGSIMAIVVAGWMLVRALKFMVEIFNQRRHEKIRASMRVSAKIKTGDRRVIEYLLSPVMQAVKEAGRER